MRVLAERDSLQSILIRLMTRRWSEIAYIKLGLSGLRLEIEFPSDWHERPAGWVRISLGLIYFAFAFPWPWTVPDDYQCSGPTFGFCFFGDGLHLHWGKTHGTRGDPFTIIDMPWHWRHREHKVLTKPVVYRYRYVLRSGEVQDRIATVNVETRLWTRPWVPHRLFKRSINVSFNDEVGERSGSWKGGVTGCGYDMLPGEAAFDTLRRMERERKF